LAGFPLWYGWCGVFLNAEFSKNEVTTHKIPWRLLALVGISDKHCEL